MTEPTEPSAYDRIRAKILRHEIAPGALVPIDRLVRELGVSRTPVREALHRLEGERLVERTEARSYATTPLLTEAQLRSVFRVRLLLEPWAARAVATDRIANPGRALLRLLADFRAEHGETCSRTALAAHDEQFHRTLHAATRNAFLRDAYDGLHAQMHLFRLSADDIATGTTLAEHTAIAQAIADCDGGTAEELMRTHLLHAQGRFLTDAGTAADAADADVPGAQRVLPRE